MSDPVKGFNEGGVGGLAMGVASGVTGLVTKPASGALGMVSKTAEGFQSVTLPERRNKRKRHPRYVGRDMVCLSFLLLESFHPPQIITFDFNEKLL